MPQKSLLTRIFVSSSLIEKAERIAASGRGGAGRPTLHTTCLVLGILATKAVFGLGYRKTYSLFEDSGWQNLPDFRTLEWRDKKIRNGGVLLKIRWCEGKKERLVVVKLSKGGAWRIDIERVPEVSAKKELKSMGTDYVELAL